MLARLSFASLLLLLGGPARANSSGITGYYGPSKTCMNCHLGQMRKGTLNLVSPAHTGKKYTFSFECADTTGTGGTLPVAGVNIYADCGGIAALETGTKVTNSQLIHTQPRPTTASAKTWEFSWTAPATSTSCGFIVAGLLGDNNKQNTGDVTCLAMKAVLVMPAPDGGAPDLPPPPKDSAPPAKKDGAAPGTDTAAPTGDGAKILDATPTDGDAGQGSGDLQAAGDGTGAGDDDGCGCRLSRRPASGGRALLLLLGAALLLVTARRRR